MLSIIIALLVVWLLPAVIVTIWAIKDRKEASSLSTLDKWRIYGIILAVTLIPIYNWFALKELKEIQ
jgi:hypothetical protein